MIATKRNIILEKKPELPKYLSQALKVRYEDVETGNTITDKSKKGNDGTVNGTVGNTTITGRNCKTFTGEGNIDLPITNHTTLTPYFLTDSTFSILSECHQGVTSDGQHFFTFDTDQIKKYDKNGSLLITNTNVLTEAEDVDHMGDGCYYDNKIYSALCDGGDDNFCTGVTAGSIGVWNASDLTYITKYDISTQVSGPSGCAINNGYLYVVNYCDGTKIWKYDLNDNMAYVGAITLSSALTSIQGLDYYGGYFYISAANKVYKYGEDGTLASYPPQGIVISKLVGGEGLCVVASNEMYVINDSSGNGEIKKYYENDNSYTIIMWLNLPNLPSELPQNYMRLFGSTDTYLDMYYLKSPAGLYCKANITTGANRPYILESSGLLKKNVWMMLTITFSGKTVGNKNLNGIYVDDGQTTATGVVNTALPPYPTGKNIIGGTTTNPEYYLIGTLGDFAFFKGKAFSVDEIKRYYGATRYRFGV
jgi:hypothetical protein